MARKKRAGRGKKKSNIKLNTDIQFKEKQISLETVQSTTAKESIDPNTLEVKTLLQTELLIPQRRSNRTRIIVDNTYPCKICHLTFSAGYNLRRHLDYYGDPKYPCTECKTKFTDKRQLETHIMNSHRNPWSKHTFKCVVCNQTFTQESHLRAHLSHYHEHCEVSTKAIDNTERYQTDVKFVIATENPESVDDSGSRIEESKKMTTQYSNTELNLETECSAKNNILHSENVENITVCPVIVFEEPVQDENKKRDERLTTKSEQTVSTSVESTDDLQNRLESNCANQAIMTENGHSICEVDDESHKLKVNENGCNSILRVNEKMVSLNEEETSLLLKPEVENGRENAITEGDEKTFINMEKMFYSPSVFEDRDEIHTSVIENTKIVTSANEEYEEPQTTPILHVELGETIVSGIKASVPISAVPMSAVPISAVPNQDDVPLGNVSTHEPQQSVSSSFQYVETENFDFAQNPKNNVLLETSLNQDKIDVTPMDFQEKLQEITADKSHHQVHDYDKEAALRRLYSCKDCYVPLMRVKIPERSNAIATADVAQSQNDILHYVIPSVVCNLNFATKDMLFQHYRLRHFTYLDEQVHCVCGKRMSGNEALNFHFYRHSQKTILSAMTTENPGAACNPLKPKFSCTGCDRNFWLDSCLRSHVYNCKSFMRQKVNKILTKKAFIPTTIICKYVCTVCCSAFRSEEKLMEHENVYSRVATYRCAFCGTMFYGAHQWRCHMATAHNPIIKKGYDFECTICNQRFNTRRLERMHRMHIHREPSILCSDNLREPSAGNLSPPDSDDPGDNEETTSKCNVCNIVFANEKRFIDHTIYYMTNETIHCKTCGEKFNGQYQAHHHNKTVHYSEDTQKAYTHHCDVCEEGFIYLTHLQAHMFHVHISAANADKNEADMVLSSGNACSVCDVKFSSPAVLAAHQSDFSNDGEYLCNRCSKKCRTPSLLLDHLTLNHSHNAVQGGVKCRRCNENFLTPSAWVSHAKHIHCPNEPSEFYLEKNIASTEKCGDIRYELIPTNESISSGVTYIKLKNSRNFSMIATPTCTDNQADKKSFFADVRKINAVIPAEKKLMYNNVDATETTGLNIEERVIKIENLDEDEVLIMSNNDKKSEDSRAQEVNSNLHLDAGQTEVNNPEKKKTERVITNNSKSSKGKIKMNWDCTTCGFIARGPANLAKHMSLYSDSGDHMCETCGRRFDVYAFYRDHKLSHINYDKSAFACTSCNEGFKAAGELKMHIAHLHANIASGYSIKIPPLNAEASNEISQELRELARIQESNDDSPLLICSVKKSESQARTYSRKSGNETETVLANRSSPKKVEATPSPHLHTEICEDEVSMLYECPDCHETYSSATRLNEHVAAVHKINQAQNQLGTRSKLLDAPIACDVCDKIFANKSILSSHREKIHFIKSAQVVKNPVPVLEITVPNKRSNDPNNDQPVIIGRLYKLEEMKSVSTPVQDAKNNIKDKFTVQRIVDANVEPQNPLPKSTVKIKANVAVRLKPPVATAVPLKPPAATAVPLKPPAATAVPLKPPAVTAKHLKSLLPSVGSFQSPIAIADKHALSSSTFMRLESPIENAVRLIKPVPNATQQLKSVTPNVARKLKSIAPNSAPLTPLARNATPLNPPVDKIVPLKTPTGKVVPLKLPIGKVVPAKSLVDKVGQVNPPVENNVQLTPVSDRQKILRTLNMGQIGFLELERRENQNTEQQKIPKTEENVKPIIITSIYSENPNVIKPAIVSDSKLDTMSPSTLIKPIEIVNVESCSDVTRTPESTSSNTINEITNTTDTKFDYQFWCNICNMNFIHGSQLAEHEKCVHSSANLNVQSAGKSPADDTSAESYIDRLFQLVGNLPVQPETESDTEDQLPFSFNFESVLIPVSDDDFGQIVDESTNNAEGTPYEINPLMINPLSQPAEKDLPSGNDKSARLKAGRSSKSKIVNNSKGKSNRKRKGNKSIEMPPKKRPKGVTGVFDPLAYEELCRQHNLIPNVKPYNSEPFSKTPRSKKIAKK